MIKIIKETDDEIIFTIKDFNPSIVNALRRNMISSVPTIAIENVSIIKNESSEHNEIIAHRLGLIPIYTNIDTINTINYRSECAESSENCNKCQVFLSLNKTNNTDKDIVIYSKDIQIENYKDRVCSINLKDIPILTLKPGKTIELLAKAIKDIGSKHAKWSPVAIANYTFKPIIDVNKKVFKNLDIKEKSEFIESCPRNVFTIDSGSNLIIKEDSCIFCNDCVKLSNNFKEEHIISDLEDLVTVRPDENMAIFTVESKGSLKPRDIVILSIESIKNMIINASNNCKSTIDM